MATSLDKQIKEVQKKIDSHKSIFDLIKENPKFHAQRSADWFQKKIKSLGGPKLTNQAGLYETTKLQQSSRILLGSLVFFAYDPKFKQTLPYYDRFPLSFILSKTERGFIGINFHYLPIPLRIKLFDKMWSIAKNVKLSSQQVTQLNYALLGIVSKFPEVVPCLKQYRFDHVKSRFIKVDIEDWKTAIMLENSEFAKVSAGNVRTISSRIAAQALTRPKRK